MTVENTTKTFINVAVHFALLTAGVVAALATASGASAQSLEIRTGDAVPRDVREMYDRGLQFLAKTQNEQGSWPSNHQGPGVGGMALMQVAPEQGSFMTLLTRIIGARFAVEVGTFTGYSTLCIARGLHEDGQLIACDVSEKWTAIGRRHWEKAGVSARVDLRIGPAIETLRGLPQDPVFDLAFIDADKPNYVNYYEEILLRIAQLTERHPSIQELDINPFIAAADRASAKALDVRIRVAPEDA